ncbi:MAG TPA: sodium:solute symporter [Ignavibacteriales bacterium]|nr:sodium:solute symporter [Ignavibacteriales bacterium]HOL81157.1 sodium:solute symporter [Ignavibacteriales bacterium]HOM65260.1 sodium:solute symporter [Ignavibacteriales bacterium]HPD66552.1 sodium:solute symporter [Ignavibacteriales bacterium]HPP33487.1 sodium:solute symporter [Ignavibacteriales bacterium]
MFINLLVIILYIFFITILISYKKNDEKEISLNWWQVSLSIVAAETSALTFVSLPGLAFKEGGNLNFLQLAIGYIIGRIAIGYILLPLYYKTNIPTAYSYISLQYGNNTKRFLSVVFILTKFAADCVRLYATSILLKVLLNIDYSISIILISGLTLCYIIFNAFNRLLKFDAYQKILFLLAALSALFLIIYSHYSEIIAGLYYHKEKFEVFNFKLDYFFSNTYSFYSSIIGGAILSFATHGTDQSIVQRLLALNNLKEGRKAIISSGVFVFIQFAILLLIGLFLSFIYVSNGIKADEVFVKFIVEKIPVGFAGLIIAGVLASAISSLSASINGISSSIYNDLFSGKIGKFKYNHIKALVTLILTILAFWVSSTNQSVIEIALGIISITFSGVLGIYILSLMNIKLNYIKAIISISCGIFVSVIFYIFNIVAWTWFMFFGVLLTILVGIILQESKK